MCFYGEYADFMCRDALGSRHRHDAIHDINVACVEKVLSGYSENDQFYIRTYYSDNRDKLTPINKQLGLSHNDLQNLLFGFCKKVAKERGLL